MSDINNSELPEVRRKIILEQLQRDGMVLTNTLTDQFAVSEDSIRRDLRELAKAGQLLRVHGGALPIAPAVKNFQKNAFDNPHAQIHVAKAAANLLENNQVIFFDGGTTTLEISRHLNPAICATAITISPQTSIVLSSYHNLEVIMIGGRMNAQSLTTEGASVMQQISEVRADVCFLGVCSLHPKIGLTTLDYEEAQVKRAFVNASSDIIAVVTADKMGTVVPYDVCSLEQISHLVTEQSITEENLAPYRKAGIEIILA
ncbi:MAG: DeoR/GlpR transcriptional regulator [Anaerolineaceae bacterium]|nr:DeoR/GlpR transcriptional regulator [Anaerolineaceae bacterium]